MSEPRQIWIDTPEGSWAFTGIMMVISMIIVPTGTYAIMLDPPHWFVYHPLHRWIFGTVAAYFFVVAIVCFVMAWRVSEE